MSGALYGVGVGPGDPALMTVRAVDLVRGADVVAYHCARHGRSKARAVAEQYLGTQIEECLTYPVTTETTDHPGGYQGAIDDFYADAATRLAAHLDAGRTVVVLAEGDPFFYGSYMHLHKRLAHRYPTEVVPGVTSVNAASAALGRPLVERDEVLTILPGTLPRAELAARLAGTDAAAVMKLGRTFDGVRGALDDAGRLDEAFYVERATTPEERSGRFAEVEAGSVPYFSVGIVPSRVHAATTDTARAETASHAAGGRGGGVVVVGLGPGGRDRLTPEAAAALSWATDVVGYATYVDRVAPNPRQRVHASDNKVESERAVFALDLARSGRRVAVVSSGDPGVFAMASAVVEVAVEYPDVDLRIVPGVTAAQAVAARVGAPLGHDYAVISLSDRLKPWDVVERRLAAIADADMAMALYNPASRSRTWQVEAAREVLLKYRLPDTPVVVGRDVGGDGERVRVVRLADLDPSEIDMRTMLLIGASTTRWTPGSPVFTPRRHVG